MTSPGPFPLTAPQLEAQWLQAYTPSDGLPALGAINGGPLDVIQAYLPRTPHKMKRQLYVLYGETIDQRTGMQHTISTHRLTLRILWPLSATSMTGEAAQAGLENAVRLTIARVRGIVLDHTHGGRFLSAAEGVTAEDQDARISVSYADPEQALAGGVLRADITYTVDDLERTA
jgi:hypothetical protein